MNVFDLFAKITLDDEEYKSKLGEAGKSTSSFSDKLKSGLATVGKVTAAGMAAAGAAAVGLGKAALESYAEYEQLVGGVDTLFKESSAKVQEYAENAYKTAGMSANDYMTTVTSFSASLLQSLDGDTAAAADYADQAIIDMADNANKMGTSLESIQNAYQGFAKQNYTMLDNLKLGYGGTKEEMERLIADANRVKEANGEMADLSIDSFADVTEAIHIIQEEMGIAGATAAEAEGTISGSAASMKAAWTNLVTGMADENANVDELLDKFISSVETTVKNVIPIVKNILVSLGKTIEERGPEMLAEGVLLLAQLGAGLIKAIPDLIKKIPEIVRAVVEEFKERGPEFKQIGKNVLEGIWNGISDKVTWLKNKVRGVVDKIKGWFTGSDGFDTHSPSKWSEKIFRYVMEGGGEGLEDGLPGLMRTAKSVTEQFKDGFDVGTANVGFEESGFGRFTSGGGGNEDDRPIQIIVKAILDGKEIGETSYTYQKNKERMFGLV